MEKEPKIETEESVINREEVQDFIKSRDIKPEDFYLIEKLASFPKRMIIMELHNLFNVHNERSGEKLERMKQNASDASKKQLFETIQQFCLKYDWTSSWNLVRLLEKI